MTSGLVVHPVEHGRVRGVGWSVHVDISTVGDQADALPFLRLELSQPAYSVPPPLRVIPEEARIAVLGQAFASILFDRFQRPVSLIRTQERHRARSELGAAFSRPGLSRCTVGGFDGKEVLERPR